MYYNQGKWVSENEYWKGHYHNEYYDDDIDLTTADESSGGESEAEPHNDSVSYEILYLIFFK